MSVTGHVIFVDWPAIRDHWRVNPGPFRRENFWDEEADNPWPPRFQAESWRLDDWIDSWKCAFQAGEYYVALRRDLSVPDRTRWDRLVAVFFQINRNPASYDLPGFEPDEGVANIISPASVACLVDEIEQVDLERLRLPFETRCRPDPDYWLKTFDEFRDYIRQWFEAVEAAHRSGKALVLWVA